MAHTKGEWVADIRVGVATVHIEDNKFFCLDGMREQCIYWQHGEFIYEGDDPHFGHYEMSEESKANARLIAAAPDMLEVVKWVTGMASHTERDSTVILMAIKALTKAEGGL